MSSVCTSMGEHALAGHANWASEEVLVWLISQEVVDSHDAEAIQPQPQQDGLPVVGVFAECG